MRWGMEILSPTSYFSNSSWLLEESRSTAKWTPAENKAFENALAVFDESTPDRWQRVAERVPGKSVCDVIRQYKELEDDVSSIEAGLIPVPGYTSSLPPSSSLSPFTLEWGSAAHTGFDGFKQSYIISGGGGRKSSGRPSEQERKKGVPWTEEEHKLFLLGLKKYGKGDWRNISRNFVISRTPTQVASHAQKYFIRQLSGGKDKRRASIHDITTVNLNDDQMSSPENKRVLSPEQSNSGGATARDLPFQQCSNQNKYNGTIIGGLSSHCLGNIFASPPNYGTNSYGYESYFEPQNMVFQMQSGFQYPNA